MTAPVPRPFQADAMRRVGEEFRKGHRGVCLVSGTGSGKTLTASMMVARWVAQTMTDERTKTRRHKRVAWGAHRSELLDQAEETLARFGVRCGKNGAGSDALVQLFTYQEAVARRQAPEADVFVADECVVGPTMLGARRADEIRVGDLVPSMDHETGRVVLRRVRRVFVRRATSLRTIHVGSRAICVTDNHPVWINGQYVSASRVGRGDMCRVWEADEAVSQRQRLQDVLAGVPGRVAATRAAQEAWQDGAPEADAAAAVMPHVRQSVPAESRQRVQVAEHVFGGVRERAPRPDDGGHEPRTRFAADAGSQSYEPRGREGAGVGDPAGHRAPAKAARRQRTWVDRTTGATFGCAGIGLGAGVRREDGWPVGIAAGREDRCGPSDLQDCDRGGRAISFDATGEGRGSAQGDVFSFARVDRVEVHEPTPDGTFGGRAPDGLVYNFEVDGDHNYFANGVLTHNCHHLGDEQLWEGIGRGYLDAGRLVLGLTATPARSDGRALPIFNALVVAAQIRELIEMGWLVPLRWRGPSATLASQKIARDPWDAYDDEARGRCAVVFAPNLRAAQAYVAGFEARGVSVALVDGKMKRSARDAALLAHRIGKVDVLVNVNLLLEGWDNPRCDCVIMARACGAPVLWIQAVGRGMRPHCGCGKLARGEACSCLKRDCLLLDLRGIAHELGRPDAEATYSLDGAGIVLAQDAALGGERLCKVCKVPMPPPPEMVCPQCGKDHSPKVPKSVNAPLTDWEVKWEAARTAVKPSNIVIGLAGILRKADEAARKGKPWKDSAIHTRVRFSMAWMRRAPSAQEWAAARNLLNAAEKFEPAQAGGGS